MLTNSRLAGVALAGGIAGLANATFCYLKWPVAVDTQFPFHWHIIPGGSFMGVLSRRSLWQLEDLAVN